METWKEIKPGGIIIGSGKGGGKTGSWSNRKPVIDPEKCIKCQQCVRVCPEKSLQLEDKTAIKVDYDYCKGCGICADVCPKKAITLTDERRSN